MKVFDVRPDQQDIYIRIVQNDRPVNVYQVQVSKRKLSAQLNAVKGFARDLILKYKK